MIGKIYKIVSSKTDKIYIGSTINKSHLYDLDGTSAQITKYSDARIELLEEFRCRSIDDLKKREKRWIEDPRFKCVNELSAFSGIEYGLDRKEYEKKYNRLQYTCEYCDITTAKKDKKRHETCVRHKTNVKYYDQLIKDLTQ